MSRFTDDEIEEIVNRLMEEDHSDDDDITSDFYETEPEGDMLDEFKDMSREFDELFSDDIKEIADEYAKLLKDYKEYTDICGDDMADDPEFIRNSIAMNNLSTLMGMFTEYTGNISGFLKATAKLADEDIVVELPDENDSDR